MVNPRVTATAIALACTTLPADSFPVSGKPTLWPGYNVVRQGEHKAVSAELAAQSQLEEICSLAKGWDGFDAFPIHPATGANASLALNAFVRAGLVPELTPNSNGTISFEWSSHAGEAYIEIGRSRYVGSIRAYGEIKHRISGSSNNCNDFRRKIMDFSSAIEVILFPHRRAIDTSKQSYVGQIRYAT
ncbi:MAG: hypothetical protein JNM13_14820 [Hyphomicrobiaceae bacterium]|nr:hypothetical protein [Hyphomicrobiaceae bacterium]